MTCLGIGPSFVAYSFTNYQRRCMQKTAKVMPKLCELVRVIGDDALECYCRDDTFLRIGLWRYRSIFTMRLDWTRGSLSETEG